MTFQPRTNEQGIWNNPYWYDLTYNRGAKNYIWLPNCTTYAYGRSVEIANGQIDCDTILGTHMGNASTWYNDTLWNKSPNYTDIQLGDILVWGIGGGIGAEGHVAVVEAIDSDYIYTSNSHYNIDNQTRNYPATLSKRYFEYARHPKNPTTYTRLYYFNQGGTVGGNVPFFNCPNFIGCIHNPYADQTPPTPEDVDAWLVAYLLNRNKNGGTIVL